MNYKLKESVNRIVKDLSKYKWAVIAGSVYYFFVKFFFHAFCPLVIVTGFPCPGCGMTRAVFYIATGRFIRGWNLNPLACLWILLAVWFFYRRYWCGKCVTGLKQSAAVIIAAMVILYVCRMITRFPSYAPIVYTGNNILSNVFTGYENILRYFGIL